MASPSTFLGSKVFVCFVVCLTLLTDTFLYGVVVPVLPYALVDRAGQRPEDIQLWNSILLAAFAGTMLPTSILVGWLGDRIRSRRWTFVCGQAVLGCATLIFAFATSIATLVIARLLQGVGSATAFTVGYALIFDAVGREQIGQAIGYTGVSMSLGLFLGPTVGGVLYDKAGYVWVFVPALILIVVEIILRLLIVEPARRFGAASNDDERQSLMRPQSPHTEYGAVESDPNRKSKHQSALRILLGDVRFLVSMVGLAIVNGFTSSMESILPIYLARLFQYSSTQVALVFLTLTVPMLFSPLVGYLVDRVGTKWPSFASFLIAVPGFVMLQIVDTDDQEHLIWLLVLLTIIGIAIAAMVTSIMTEVTYAAESLEIRKPDAFGEYGALSQVFGLQNAALGVGALVGPLLSGLLMDNLGWTITSIALGAVAGIMAFLALFVTGGKLWKNKEEMVEA